MAGLVEAQVLRTPAAPALRFGQRAVTYRELNAAANRLAHRLGKLGVGEGDAVGVCVERSVEMVVAVLAVLKAGGAYVPLDPAYPDERLQFMLSDARARILLTQHSLAGRFAGCNAMCLDREWASLDAECAENPARFISAERLAYLIYTSGSTGQPKAVAMGHGPLCNLLRWQRQALPGAARTLQFASLSFDVSFQEIFSTLDTGGTLVLVTDEIRRDPAMLLRLMEEEAVERLFLPFVALQQIAATAELERLHPSRLREVIAAGEQLRITPQIRSFFAKTGCALHNHYGPAESHVVTAHKMEGEPAGWPALAPIGRPIAGATIRILDEARQPAATGELFIGGACLARGYFNRPELTAAHFLADPFSDDPAARLYRSGDLARIGADGVLEFLGRCDDQIKVRGVRVEPGEVEAALSQHPALRQVAVTAHDDGEDGQRLTAHFVLEPGQRIERGELRSFLRAKLPAPLLPSAFVEMERMPLTPSGKVDRRALPRPAVQRAEPLVAPRDGLAKQLAAIWEEVLGVHPIGSRDDFFDLGGDSLRAVQAALAIEKKCGLRVPVGKFYECPTIDALAEYLSREPRHAEPSDTVVLNAAGARPPFFCVYGSLDLGRRLGPDQPFVRLDLPLEKTTSVNGAITEMAAHSIRTIRAAQPRGPYRLGGFSLGGVVAFEIAHQLHAQGEETALLVLIDPDPPHPTLFHAVTREIARLGLRAAVRHQIERVARRLVTTKPRELGTPRADGYREVSLEEKLYLFWGRYRAPKAACPIALLLARDHFAPPKPRFDPRLDWRAVAAKGIEVHVIAGDHHSIAEEPNIRVLADLLRTCLSKALVVASVWSVDASLSLSFLAES